MDIDSYHQVYDLILVDGRGLRTLEITHLLSTQLADRILAIPIPTHRSLEMRVWDYSCCPKVPTQNLVEICRPLPTGESRLLGFRDWLFIPGSNSFFTRLHGTDCLLVLFSGMEVWKFCWTIRFVGWRMSQLNIPCFIARGHV